MIGKLKASHVPSYQYIMAFKLHTVSVVLLQNDDITSFCIGINGMPTIILMDTKLVIHNFYLFQLEYNVINCSLVYLQLIRYLPCHNYYKDLWSSCKDDHILCCNGQYKVLICKYLSLLLSC